MFSPWPPTISFKRLSTQLLFHTLPLSLLPSVGAQELTSAQIDVISARLAEGSLKSWELGTRAQAILELNATTYSVFSGTPLPPPSTVSDDLTKPLEPFFDIARDIIRNITTSDVPQPLMPDGSAADPASNGVCVLLANWTQVDGGDIDYEGAARHQLEYLLSEAVPKTQDGAISHRVGQVQLWNDFVYMVPPFLAYYGALTMNRTLLAEAHNQIKLYREYLRDPKSGMWRHILSGSEGNDPGFWATGNGWAAAGMLRVHATIQNSEYANTLQHEQDDLAEWVAEVHDAVYKHIDSTNIFTNYADQPHTASGNFYDASSTALIAATVYRASTHLGQHGSIRYAERSRKAIHSPKPDAQSDSQTLSNYVHFTPDGWLRPVVNPHMYGLEGSKSAEGQAFVVMLQAAYHEWKDAGMLGSGVGKSFSTGPYFWSGVLFFAGALCLFS